MTELSALKALHMLSAVVWVGGMAFALLVLRPSLSILEPPQRLALHAQVFRRFFLIVWHTMPLLLLTGYAMLFGLLGGFVAVNWAVHTMHLLGLIMTVIFLVVFFGPWRSLQAALAVQDRPKAATAADTIRKMIGVNLVLGTLTVLVAAWAQ